MSVHTLIFDLDDTLYDYRQFIRGGFRAVAERLSYERDCITQKIVYKHLCEEYFERGNRDRVFQSVISEYNFHTKIDELVHIYRCHPLNIKIGERESNFLKTLSEEYELILLTDGMRGHEKIKKLGIQTIFDHVIANNNESKRHKECYNNIITKFDLNPNRCMSVGDDPIYDHYWPNMFGMKTILKLGGIIHEPPKKIESYDGIIHNILDLNYYLLHD